MAIVRRRLRGSSVDLQMPYRNFGGLPKKFGAQKTSYFGPLFPRLPHSTPHISGTKRRMDKQKWYNVYS